MLDSETKRRIDTCRDILVGKVPDPKSQVEQITIALIYKFMDDMDAEAEELGGKRSFFAGAYARFGWARLLAPGLGGFEVLALYSEAIQSMRQNPGLPELFRDIFKNAYLPYRDPETLKSFLKEINTFTYDHSERLGDAFEYLLSVLGSQGDAGQFRTPRHIIDFMVAVIDPKKEETILDPACGTAGFLISAWKHILAANPPSTSHSEKNSDSPNQDKGQQPKPLTPDERIRLANNIRGYDISPDMVRLSLVNLYLHGFHDPHIVEYDTLTSDEKWNELADVILANPPFMSPKGGIKPHKRFTVQASRSEVLFVDYMAEHLTATGRAAIIVPEGIIFQSGTAYKALRKMLVDTSLVAVVSLPAGVFNPYSGVKTSILILDKRVHKQTDKVLFVKVLNDGFNLGAQRRAVVNSDLPEATRLLRSWMTAPAAFEGDSVLAVAVTRERIAASGDWNCSGDRYQASAVVHSQFAQTEIGDVVTTLTAPLKIQKPDYAEKGNFPIIDQSQQAIAGWTDDETALIYPSKPLVIFGDHTCAVKLIERPFAQGADGIKILQTTDALSPHFLYYFLKSNPLESDGYKRHFGDLKLKTIPLPPLEVQHQIVAEIEGYQKIIDGARQVLDNYKPHIVVSPDWEEKRLSEITECISDGDHQAPPKSDEGVPFVTISNIDDQNRLDFTKTFFVPQTYFDQLGPTRRPQRNDTLYSVTGSFGIPVLVDSDKQFCFQRHIALLRPSSAVNAQYLYFFMASPLAFQQAEKTATGVAQKTVSLGSLRNFKIPLPDLATQRAIVTEIEAEQALVAANRELIDRMEAKIKAAINRVWGSSS